ncbi:efflux RND transporter periplasmic adaptor subunit [Thiomicrospira microaerophila]|uniref:efflux RND transporter periplasmic adaptor subunit n=1 Tax=Thiomicrospira microaerophila TaxID=406020 RepID=UPI0005C9B3C3|nr:efflux RND transporter periplasmic adaptor subunit [Thiomicrospira microaerophila]
MKVDVKGLIENLRALRAQALDGLDETFWAGYIDNIVPLCLAQSALLFEQSQPTQTEADWRLKPDINSPLMLDNPTVLWQQPWIHPLLERAWQNGFAVSEPVSALNGALFLVFKLVSAQPTLMLLTIPKDNQPRLSEILLRAQLIADMAALEGKTKLNLQQTGSDRDQIVNLLSLLVEVQAAKNFQSACYSLVNGLVGHTQEIDQAVLGWQEGDYVRIKTLSHYDKFEKKTDIIKLYEAALEEAVDQRTPINYPADQYNPSLITLAHQQLKAHLDAHQLFSFPIYDQRGEVVAVISLISQTKAFSKELLDAVCFVTGLLSETLIEFKKAKDFWFIKAFRASQSFLRLLLGRRYVWSKVISIILMSFILWGTFGTLPHRITGVTQLITDSTQLVSAPFDGQLSHVYATSGDEVEQGTLLAQIDTQDILLQLTEMQAELQRNQAEVDRARASFNLVETEIAMARVRQMQARLDRLNFQLSQADIKAPFAGAIVEGERKDLLGSPVRKGQILYRIARVEGLYLVIEVPQEDIDYIQIGSTGEFALVSQPNITHKIQVTHILPMARVKGPKGAHFEVKAQLIEGVDDWWRPGMTGVAKIDVGDARAFWVLGHKMVDRLRLILWW